MKRLLLITLLLLLVLTSCKKENLVSNQMVDRSLQVTVSGISSSNISEGSIVTLYGTNFGNSISRVTVFFNGISGMIISLTDTQITVMVPETSSGLVNVKVDSKTVKGPTFVFTYPAPGTSYTTGNVILQSQADVSNFIASNKGKQIKITGNLVIGGDPNYSDIITVSGLSNITSVSGGILLHNLNRLVDVPFLNTITTAGSISVYNSAVSTLNFRNLKSLTGEFILYNLNKLSEVSFSELTKVSELRITLCPLLNDVSFLNNITSAESITLGISGITSLQMDKLTNLAEGSIMISGCESLSNVSFKSLTKISNIQLYSCSKLSTINFGALTTVSDKLRLQGIHLIDLSGFNMLKTTGSISISNNPALANFHGLELLTTFTTPAIVPRPRAGVNPVDAINGIYISNNAILSSLKGLQNISGVPIIYIAGNKNLNDLCPLKAEITALKAIPSFTYSTYSTQGLYGKATTQALTLQNNGNYTNDADAFAAIAMCR